jgi:hypothetical protein
MRQTNIISRETLLFLSFFFSEEEDAELIVKKHIALLHLYNEAKDATQVRVERFYWPKD